MILSHRFNFLTSDVTIPRAPSDEYRTMDHQLKIVSSSEVEVAHAAEQTAGLVSRPFSDILTRTLHGLEL